MKRLMVSVSVVGLTAVLLSGFAHAVGGPPGSISATTPAAESLLGGTVTIGWTYEPGIAVSETSTVVAEAKLGGPIYTFIGSAPITALTMPWDTTGLADAAGYQLRLRVDGTNRQSIVSGLAIDNTAPELSVTVDPAACGAGWCGDALALVNVTASDASGLELDPSGSYEITAEGANALSYTARDLVGNETTQAVTVSLDHTAPALTATVAPAACEAPGWCNDADVAVEVSASDAHSGLAVDPSGSYSVLDEGINELTFEAIDNVGRATSITVSVQIDRTGPTTVIDAPAIPVIVRALGDALTGSATDALSGVAATEVMFVSALDGSPTTLDASCSTCPTTSASWSVSTAELSAGLYTVTAVSTDAAGNVGAPSAPVQVLLV